MGGWQPLGACRSGDSGGVLNRQGSRVLGTGPVGKPLQLATSAELVSEAMTVRMAETGPGRDPAGRHDAVLAAVWSVRPVTPNVAWNVGLWRAYYLVVTLHATRSRAWRGPPQVGTRSHLVAPPRRYDQWMTLSFRVHGLSNAGVCCGA